MSRPLGHRDARRSTGTSGDLVFRQMLDDAIAGSESAYTELYRSFAPRVKAFALTRRVDDPDGVANDVMLRVFQNLGGFSGGEAAFVSWVFSIARNRVIDLHRAAQRRPACSGDEPAETGGDGEVSAEEAALDRLGLDRALDLLGVLTEDQRDVVALRLIADLSLADVADIVHKPISAVKALQRRGLARLQREILEQGCPDDR